MPTEEDFATQDTEPPEAMTQPTDEPTQPSSVPPVRLDHTPIGSMTDEAVERELLALLAPSELRTERRIMLYLARRYCGLGLECYGPAALDDERDNVIEAAEEGADLLFYLGREAVKRGG